MESEDCLSFETPDTDACSPEDISSFFTHRYIEVSHSNIITNRKDSCANFVAQNEENSFAFVLSDNTVNIIDKENFALKNSYAPHTKKITHLKFLENPNVICSSSLDGILCLWDGRSNEEVKTINMKGEEMCPITAFDISLDERVICGGTELIRRDSYLLFYDMRGDKLLGGYWECHSDDITCVKFNPNNANTMASSATDGLINVFDIGQTNEDDALTYSLNPEESVLNLQWFRSLKTQKLLATTDIQSVQLWNVEKSSPDCNIKRNAITNALKRKVEYECYIVPFCNDSVSNNPVILAASGLEYLDSYCLRTLTLNQKSGVLEPHGIFVEGNNSHGKSITTCALYQEKENSYLTVKENGTVSLWHESDSTTSSNNSTKIKKNVNQLKRKNPY